MEVKNVKIGVLKPYERNNKKHPQEQVDLVAESIKQYGFVQPIVCDKDNVVVIGHCRLLAAKKLKLKEVPVVYVEDLTDEQVRKLRILDNKTNESPWDFDNLQLELDELDFTDFGDLDFGFDDQLQNSEFIQDILNDKSFHNDNLDINKMIFVISFAFPKEDEELVKPYLINNKDEITQRLIEEARNNATMR